MQDISGLVGTPVTPFTPGEGIDDATYADMVRFLVGAGVDAVAMPMHIGESINLSLEERQRVTELAVEAADNRVPVLINVSFTGSGVAAELARHAASVGANGIVCLPPYHWRPPPEGMIAHFMEVGTATDLPLVLYNSPKLGVVITPDILTNLIERLPNLIGMKDASFDLRYFTEITRVAQQARPGFSTFSGIDYPLPTMVVGGRGTFSLFSQLVPRLARSLYDACAAGEFAAAKQYQQDIDRLWSVVRRGYASGVKAALEVMGRPVGPSRLPVVPYSAQEKEQLAVEMAELEFLKSEPRGWDPHDIDVLRGDGPKVRATAST